MLLGFGSALKIIIRSLLCWVGVCSHGVQFGLVRWSVFYYKGKKYGIKKNPCFCPYLSSAMAYYHIQTLLVGQCRMFLMLSGGKNYQPANNTYFCGETNAGIYPYS